MTCQKQHISNVRGGLWKTELRDFISQLVLTNIWAPVTLLLLFFLFFSKLQLEKELKMKHEKKRGKDKKKKEKKQNKKKSTALRE